MSNDRKKLDPATRAKMAAILDRLRDVLWIETGEDVPRAKSLAGDAARRLVAEVDRATGKDSGAMPSDGEAPKMTQLRRHVLVMHSVHSQTLVSMTNAQVSTLHARHHVTEDTTGHALSDISQPAGR